MTTKGTLKSDNEVALFINGRCPGFEYAGNYTGADGRADIRCKQCGIVFNRSMISIRKNHFGCPTCNQKKREQRQAEKERLKHKKARRPGLTDVNTSSQMFIRFCGFCGSPFFTTRSRSVFCSDKCAKASHLKTRGSDDRLNKANTVDRDITLEKVFERDGGLCWICGKPCDWSDYRIKSNGVFIAGNNYPSKDHIIALAKGGLHEWGNIRLAHRLCNSKRGAKR